MAKKRGLSGLSLVIGIDKPKGMSSHDVVNRVRRVFGERRVGHTGTLDPLASGAMVVCVGPAARLDNFLVGHDKRYRARIAWGQSTTTDDAEGDVLATGDVRSELLDEHFAEKYLRTIIGPHRQLPPVYSALKVGGKKACDEARKGNVIELTPRAIDIYDARLVGIGTFDDPWWDVDLHVSAGTYIRSIARDAGVELGCPAHLSELRRVSVGRLGLEDCVTLETLEEVGTRATIDPLRILGLRFAFARDGVGKAVENGNFLPGDLVLCERGLSRGGAEFCACTSGVRESCEPPMDGELIAIVDATSLLALYAYDGKRNRYQAKCVFNVAISRGMEIVS